MKIQKLSHASVLDLLPDRHPEAHKGDFGKILLLCGSEGFTGAAALAAMGALRSGAGLVYLGVPRSIYAIEAVKLTEAIVFPLPEEDGKLSAAAHGCRAHWSGVGPERGDAGGDKDRAGRSGLPCGGGC